MSAGRKSWRITPFEGLAFLTSAMTAGSPAAMRRSIAAANPRTGGPSAARAARSASVVTTRRSATSSRLRARIRSRMSVNTASSGCHGRCQAARDGDELVQPGPRRAAGHGLAGAPDAVGDVPGHAGHVQRGAGVEGDDLARQAGLAVDGFE